MPNDNHRTVDCHGLEVSFGTSTKHQLQASSPHYPWTEVTIVDEDNPNSINGDSPVVSNYAGAHTIYHGYMEQFESKGGKRLLAIREVALKWVVGVERVAGIKREAALYGKQMKSLQGTVVPRFHGCFLGIIGDVEIGCLVLEWCKRVAFADQHELNRWLVHRDSRLKMLACVKLHKAGVNHGQLLETSHYIALGDGTLRIVGFSSARTHACAGTTVLSKDTIGDSRLVQNCVELAALELRFGVEATLG